MSHEIQRFAEAIRLVQKQTRRNVPAQQIQMFLLVGANPGITMPELGRALDMPQGTVSRNVKALSQYLEWVDGEQRRQGYGLLYAELDEVGSQTLAVYLTDAGKAVLRDLQKVITDR